MNMLFNIQKSAVGNHTAVHTERYTAVTERALFNNITRTFYASH